MTFEVGLGDTNCADPNSGPTARPWPSATCQVTGDRARLGGLSRGTFAKACTNACTQIHRPLVQRLINRADTLSMCRFIAAESVEVLARIRYYSERR
jgi:hypothetical protein